MDWNMIMEMQKVLDDRIMDKIGRTRAEVSDEKLLALLVEVGELANETRNALSIGARKGQMTGKIF